MREVWTRKRNGDYCYVYWLSVDYAKQLGKQHAQEGAWGDDANKSAQYVSQVAKWDKGAKEAYIAAFMREREEMFSRDVEAYCLTIN